MSELITDEIVEATARAFYEAEEREVGTLEVHPWDGVIGERREAWKICARAALDVAAPLIAGRALDGARKELQQAYKAGPGHNLQESSPSGWQKGFARAHRIVRDFQREVTGR